jgi:magnesium-transporting ATPase (P-type)
MAALAAIVTRWWTHRRSSGRPAAPEVLLEVPPGLTEEEAAARWSEGQDNAVHLKPPRTRQQIWRENVYTIFNLNLVGLAFVQLLLARWLDALLSLGTIVLNVSINVAQEMLAKRRLAEFQQSARPKATVVRDGRARSIDPDRVVPGDLLLVGPGDQFLVDGKVVGAGRMVVDESMVTDQGGWQSVRAGDLVYAGSFCISGRGAYVAQKVGDERLVVARLADTPPAPRELTPLECLVDRILRILLVLVAIYAVLLLSTFFRVDLGKMTGAFNDAASVIFNMAPSGLFLMIVVTYATGTADLAKLGALVPRARSVESLAEATVICFAEAGILTGTAVDLASIQHPGAGDGEPLPESRLRQILGDLARSTATPNSVTRVLSNTFEGSRRAVHMEVPFLAAYGWSAITFDEQDLPGVYILGEPEILSDHLVSTQQPVPSDEEEGRSRVAVVRRLASPLGRLFKRGDQKEKEEALHEAAVARDLVPLADAVQKPERDEQHEPHLRRWVRRIGQTLRRAGTEPEDLDRGGVPPPLQTAPVPETVLLLAYHPEPTALHDAEGSIQLPGDLVPLCELRYARRLRPEAVEIVKAFARTGISIKVFASEASDQILDLLRQAGPGNQDRERLQRVAAISGHDLDQLSRANPSTLGAEWGRAAAENSLFIRITPAQRGALIRALRARGESVVVVGDGVADLPALQQANVAIVRQTGTQAALGVADVVMMGGSPEVLRQILEKGQRIVHGLLDVLKLNLVQVFYLALLIGAIQLWSVGFPYASAQGGAIAVITVALPSVGLSLWAANGRVSSAHYGQILARFVAPAAVTVSAAALGAYTWFLDRTGWITYAQLGVTYTLIYSGLLLAVFLKPPWHRRQTRDGGQKREWRMVALVLFLGIVAFFLPGVPAAQKYLKLDWLQQPADYGIVALVVAVWAVVLSLVWWLLPPVDEASVA